jgi:hypothetical protein
MMQASGTRKASELKKTECKAFFRLLGKVVKYKNAMPTSNVFIYLMQYCPLYACSPIKINLSRLRIKFKIKILMYVSDFLPS